MTDFSWHETIEAARRRAELSVQQLWLAYLSFSGIADLVEVEAYLHGLMPLPAYQEEKLAHAVNERLDDLYQATRVLDVKPSAADPATENPLEVIDELVQEATRVRAEE
jgi:hypothetical protein